MTTCCTRLSKWYMLTTNTLFFCLGTAFLVLGVIGRKDSFQGASVFPKSTFKDMIILGALICAVSLIGVASVFSRSKWVIYIYMMVVLACLVFQVMIGAKLYEKAANKSAYLTELWTFSTDSYRSRLQDQFDCCGFQTIGAYCSINNSQTCAKALQSFVSKNFTKLYYVLFAAISFELLAMSNSITIICAGTPPDESDNVRLDYAPNYTSSDKEALIYTHSNLSNKFSDTYQGHTIHNNRHGN